MRQVLHVDDFDETDEEKDLRLEVGDERQETALLDRVVGSHVLAMFEEVLEREDQGADEHVRVHEGLVDGVHKFASRRAVRSTQDFIECLKGLVKGEMDEDTHGRQGIA